MGQWRYNTPIFIATEKWSIQYLIHSSHVSLACMVTGLCTMVMNHVDNQSYPVIWPVRHLKNHQSHGWIGMR